MTKRFDYEIIYLYLQKLITNELVEHDKIPSENQLSKQFNLTRTTVRQGISKLKSEGLIYSKKGSGYFVNSSKIPYNLSLQTSFSKEIEKVGKKPSLKIANIKKIKADEILSQKFDIKVGSEVLELDTIRFVDGIPFLFANNYINIQVVPDFDTFLDTDTFSFTLLLMKYFNIKLSREYSEIEIVSNSHEAYTHLNIQNIHPLIKVSSRSFDEQKQNVIEYVESYFRSDMAKIRIDFNTIGKNYD